MIKNYGNVECFNDEKDVKHILSDDDSCNALCGAKFIPVRRYNRRKDYMLIGFNLW